MAQIELSAAVIQPELLREYRKRIRESQDRFWARFGVSQSRGSRFEQGAEIPIPIIILLGLYLNGMITDGDLKQVSIPDFLKVKKKQKMKYLRRIDKSHQNRFNDCLVT